MSNGQASTRSWEERLATRASQIRGDFLLMLFDLIAVSVCLATALLVRHGGAVPPQYWRGYLFFLPIVAVGHIAAHALTGLYGRIWRYVGVAEARRLLVAGFGATFSTAAADIALERPLGLSVVIGGGLLTTMLVGIVRFHARLFAFQRVEQESGVRVVMLGAGDTGARLLRQMADLPSGEMVPVAVLDDDPDKVGRMCVGLRVAGSFTDLPRVAADYEAHQALLAVPTASPALIRKMADLCTDADISLRVLPEPAERLHSPYRVRDARAVAIEDLLGRQPVRSDLADLAALLTGRRVLVTGGGGSIGSELVRQIAHLQPRSLLILDHDETHLYDTIMALPSRPSVEVRALLADVRDADRIRRLLAEHQPDVAFHAAAHKHVPMLEDHPIEACLTNVVGTRNVVRAAKEAGVGTFVLVSTDKAVQATSVMGASKRVAEQIVLTEARQHDLDWGVVRFGNVLGSRGSVVPLFTRQITAGGPVTVTDPRMRRYFMTIPEAVQLVLRAGSMARGGDLFLLEMGEPVQILELAKRMVRLAGYRLGEDIEIRIVGCRPGEELEEALCTASEETESTEHPSILRVLAPTPSASGHHDAVRRIETACWDDDPATARAALLAAAALPSVERTAPSRWVAS